MIIMIDPGHGGKDPGAVWEGMQEKNLNLDLAFRVAKHLEKEKAVGRNNLKVSITREIDTFLSLQERMKLATAAQADLFVSIHVNAGGGTGFESFINQGSQGLQESSSRQARELIHDEINKVLSHWQVRDRGKKEARFYVLRTATMPSVLLECLFIDHLDDRRLLKQEVFLNVISLGIARGIMAYEKLS